METTPKVISDNTSVAIPTLQELVDNEEMTLKQNALMVLLNQPPQDKWLKEHPMTKGKYIPIERVEWLLSYIFTRWWVEVKDVKVIANSVAVSVRLFVINPLDGKEIYQDGVGACPIQTNKGAGAMDWNEAKSTGVQIALPAAKSYAVKDAAEGFGKLFGKDTGRAANLSYDAFLRGDAITLDDLKQLAEEQKDNESITADEWVNIERVIGTEEKKSYTKIHKLLTEKSK